MMTAAQALDILVQCWQGAVRLPVNVLVANEATNVLREALVAGEQAQRVLAIADANKSAQRGKYNEPNIPVDADGVGLQDSGKIVEMRRGDNKGGG